MDGSQPDARPDRDLKFNGQTAKPDLQELDLDLSGKKNRFTNLW